MTRWKPLWTLIPGSRLDADHPENGVLIPCRNTVRIRRLVSVSQSRHGRGRRSGARLVTRTGTALAPIVRVVLHSKRRLPIVVLRSETDYEIKSHDRWVPYLVLFPSGRPAEQCRLDRHFRAVRAESGRVSSAARRAAMEWLGRGSQQQPVSASSDGRIDARPGAPVAAEMGVRISRQICRCCPANHCRRSGVCRGRRSQGLRA